MRLVAVSEGPSTFRAFPKWCETHARSLTDNPAEKAIAEPQDWQIGCKLMSSIASKPRVQNFCGESQETIP